MAEGTEDAAKVAEVEKLSFTQDELNKMMSENRKKLTQQNTDAIAELTKLKDQVKMSSQQKIDLELKINELEESFLSKDELAKKTVAKQVKEHQQLVDKLTTERDDWRGRHSIATTTRALQDAAIAEEAISPNQIVAMLGQTTHLVEAIEDSGKATYKIAVKFNDTDDDGKSIISDLSPVEAVKRMKELPALYGNLFKGTAKGGVGGEAGAEGGDSKQLKLEEITNDPEKYREWRKENPDLDTSKLRR